MLLALMSGEALTATELAAAAGVTLQTASTHLKKLAAVNLLCQRKQGRHRYFSLADSDVGDVLESMMGLAAKRGLTRIRTGPKDPALRKARVCYDHLAGELGVEMYGRLIAEGHLLERGENVNLTAQGETFVSRFGIDLAPLSTSRRPLCKSCLDWSARRSHLAGALGAAILDRFFQLGWAKREKNSRVVTFSPEGEKHFQRQFGLDRSI